MGHIECSDRLVIVAFGDECLPPDEVGDAEILGRRLSCRDYLFAGIEARFGLGLPVAAAIQVIGAADRHYHGRYEKGAQHLQNAPAHAVLVGP
jgi:hypothetical protein